MQRQAATSKGFDKRLRDVHFERVKDDRYAPNVRHELDTMLNLLVTAMATMAKSLRHAEQRTEQILKKHGPWQGLYKRIADNTFGKVIRWVSVSSLVERLQGLIKAEHRRGNLKPTVLRISTAAIDGKNVATLHWRTLCQELDLEPQAAKPKQVKRLLKKRFPNLQFCQPKVGEPYALARVHTVTLISSLAACCIHERPIPGSTNEIGAMPGLLKELHQAYGRCGLIEMLTTDAGNTSLKTATMTVNRLRLGYFAQMKSEHGDVYAEAERALGSRSAKQSDLHYTDTQNGKVATYHIWHEDLGDEGWLNWTHARQFVRVQRVAEDLVTGDKTLGNRSKTVPPEQALTISRAHWRCEEETHWTSDAMLLEDQRRLAWSRHPNGVFVASVLRKIALVILAVARKLSRFGYTRETPSWRQVAEHFALTLCATNLLTEKFDAVD
jgi:hypothetical protein